MTRIDPALLAPFLAEARAHLATLGDGDANERQRNYATEALGRLCRLKPLADLEPLIHELSERMSKTDGDAVTRLLAAADALIGRIEATQRSPHSPAPADFDAEEQRMLRGFFQTEAREHLDAAQEALLEVARQSDARECLATLL